MQKRSGRATFGKPIIACSSARERHKYKKRRFRPKLRWSDVVKRYRIGMETYMTRITGRESAAKDLDGLEHKKKFVKKFR